MILVVEQFKNKAIYLNKLVDLLNLGLFKIVKKVAVMALHFRRFSA